MEKLVMIHNFTV